jgi:hypothetical protein
MALCRQGIKKLNRPRKPLPTGFIKNQKNRLVFIRKFSFWNLRKENRKPSGFLKNRAAFPVYQLVISRFVIQNSIFE